MVQLSEEPEELELDAASGAEETTAESEAVPGAPGDDATIARGAQ